MKPSDLATLAPAGRDALSRILSRATSASKRPVGAITARIREQQAPLAALSRPELVELAAQAITGMVLDDFAEPVTLWLPLPPSWNRVFKARAMPLGGGKFTAQVYKSSEGKAYEKAIAELAKVEGLSPWPKTQMLRFSGVVAMERAGCDMDDRLKVFFDALKGVLFDDDEQVAEYGTVRRIVDSKRPGITATFEPIAVDRYGDPTQPTLFQPTGV